MNPFRATPLRAAAQTTPARAARVLARARSGRQARTPAWAADMRPVAKTAALG